MVTRCPIEIQLIQKQSQDTWIKINDKIYNWSDDLDIAKLINEQTKINLDKNKSKSKEITDIPIKLQFHKDYQCDLSLVDLPGIIKIAARDQSESLIQQIKNLIQIYA